MTYTDDQLDALMRRFTPKQRAKLERLDRAPWKWFTTDAKFFALVDEYHADAQKRYWSVLSRVAAYEGEDYRIQLKGQTSWVRASKGQYDQAELVGIPRSIGVPVAA